MSLFQDPLFQSAGLPFVATLVGTGLLRVAGGHKCGPFLASAAIVFGLLCAYVAMAGIPPFPPRISDQRYAYLVTAALVFAFVLELSRAGKSTRLVGAGLSIVGGVSWLGWPLLKNADGFAWTVTLVIVISGMIVVRRLLGAREDTSDAAVMLLVAALGTSAIAFFAHTVFLAQLGTALAAATAGYLLWNWPVVRFRFGYVGTLGAGTTLIFLMSLLAFYTNASAYALLALVAAFFADAIIKRIPTVDKGSWPYLRPLAVGVISAIPVAAGVALGYLLAVSRETSGYY